MNHLLVLSLGLVERTDECYTFSLAIRNQSAVRLLLPLPDVSDLHFRRLDNGKEAQWYSYIMIHLEWAGLVLQPHEIHELPYFVKTTQDKEPDDRGFRFRTRVALLPGRYEVFFRFRVDSDYFDSDSLFRMPDLERRAASEEAVVWMGEVVSNKIEIDHDPLRHWE